MVGAERRHERLEAARADRDDVHRREERERGRRAAADDDDAEREQRGAGEVDGRERDDHVVLPEQRVGDVPWRRIVWGARTTPPLKIPATRRARARSGGGASATHPPSSGQT